MAFGKKASVQRETTQPTQPTQPTEQTQNQISSQTPNTTFVNFEDGEDASQQMGSNQGSSNFNSGKPLFDEVVLIDAAKGKNGGGTKRWRCKHCNKTISSSYSRIHHHFFRPQVGVKAENWSLYSYVIKSNIASTNKE